MSAIRAWILLISLPALVLLAFFWLAPPRHNPFAPVGVELLAGDVFTRSQIKGYMDLKWEEIYAYEHTPHPMEFKLYYSC